MCLDKIAPVDVEENNIIELQPEILAGLLKDRTTGKNIIWATDDYSHLGDNYQFSSEIVPEAITGEKGNIIMPRAVKSKLAQSSRTRNMAEVFTPTWICNKMNNLVDEAWFGRSNVFNEENGTQWSVREQKVAFPDYHQNQPKGWESYIGAKRLEITCGEAPYLVSRYDTVTGEAIPVEQRVGILDRKFQIINERTVRRKDKQIGYKRWRELAIKALRSTYGFEWQGDNVLLARENLLYTVMDYFYVKFGEQMPQEWLPDLVEIISWNIWQMDGLKCVVPNSCHDYKKQPKTVQASMFDTKAFSASVLKRSVSLCDVNEDEMQKCQGCLKDNVDLHNGVYCKIKNWSTGQVIQFKDLLSGQRSEGCMEKDFKFDVVIGNPPYHEESTGEKPSSESVYNYFVEQGFALASLGLFITPARFLFNAGNTPKVWNQKMLNDEHLKVVYYEKDSQKVFSNTDIKGGIAIYLRDINKNFGAIGTFTPYLELNSIWKKVHNIDKTSLTDIMYNQNKFNLDELLKDYPKLKSVISSNGKEKRMTSGCLVYECFKEQGDENDSIILGVINNKRYYKKINQKYVEEPHENFRKYKVIMPANNGAGALGEVMSTPVVGTPFMGFTQTFISLGAFDTEIEAKNALKYIKTKFCRVLLSILKVTQNGKRDVWKCIPIQNFNMNSDIDWTKTVKDIDQQLYIKYGLNQEEITFIETNVKPME